MSSPAPVPSTGLGPVTRILVITIASIGFLFDTYELLMFPVIGSDSIAELEFGKGYGQLTPEEAAVVRAWGGRMLWIAALAGFQIVHVLGLIAMGLLLLPGLSPTLTAAARAGYISAHVWRWRIGWLPWQLCAASDVWLSAALIGWVRRFQIPRATRWALLGALFLVIAIVPEQYAEARLVGSFVDVPPARFSSWCAGR